jgi:hypothetical protein
MLAAPDFEARLFEMGFRNLLLSEGRHSASSWEAVWIHCRRLAMSVDNVLAVARGDTPLVLIGIGLSLPPMVWGRRLRRSSPGTSG